MKPSIQQRVMHHAHIIFRAQLLESPITWSEALCRAWELYYLRQWLRQGVVQFTYVKQDGTLREAHGTLNPDVIPDDQQPTGKQQALIDDGLQQPNWKSINYYDLDKAAWRSLRAANLVAIVRTLPITMIEC